MRKKKLILWIAISAGISFLIVAGFVLLCFTDNHITRHELLVRSYFWGNRNFDAAIWMSSIPTNYSTLIERADIRGQMLFSLIQTHRVIGMTREQVSELLGNPDWPDDGYSIGRLTGLRIDPDVFYLSFDASHRVRDYRVVQK